MRLHFFSAFKNSLNGLFLAWEDASFRRAAWQVLAAFIVAALLYAYRFVDLSELAILLVSQLPILVVELLNTAVEAVTDKASPNYSALAKKAKDVGSAAVLMTRLMALAVWLLVWLHAAE